MDRDAPAVALRAADRVLLSASATFLFVSAAAGSAGLRGAMLSILALALVVTRRRALLTDIAAVPRAVLVALLAWGLIALLSVAWSPRVHFSLEEVRSEIGYGMLAFCVFFLTARRLGRWQAWWIAIMAGTVAVFIAQLMQDVLHVRLSRHDMDGGPGPWSTHLVLVAPLLLMIVWPRPWGLDRGNFAKAVAMLLLLIAGATTGNRMIWAALGVELAVLLAISRSMPSMAAERVAMLRRLTLFATAALVIGFAASVLEKNVQHYRFDPSVTASIDRDMRPKIWSVAWAEFRTAPVLGHGFGREILESSFIPLTPPGVGHPSLRHGHNVFVDVALQMGLVGLAIFIALLAALAREYRHGLRDERSAPWGVIGLAMLAGFMVKNLTDDFFYRHNALVFWALNGMLLGLACRAREPLERPIVR